MCKELFSIFRYAVSLLVIGLPQCNARCVYIRMVILFSECQIGYFFTKSFNNLSLSFSLLLSLFFVSLSLSLSVSLCLSLSFFLLSLSFSLFLPLSLLYLSIYLFSPLTVYLWTFWPCFSTFLKYFFQRYISPDYTFLLCMQFNSIYLCS